MRGWAFEMDSYSYLDTYTWTPCFVSANKTECLRILRLLISTVEELIGEKNYPDAITGLKKISIGLIKMENENLANFDKQDVLLAFMMPAVAILGILDADAPEDMRRKAALQYALGMERNPNHELAACSQIAKDMVQSYITDLQSGAPLAQILRKYDFPADAFNALRSLDRELSEVSSSYAPSDSYSSPAVSSPLPEYSVSTKALPTSSRPIGCLTTIILLAVIIGGLFFFAAPFIRSRVPAVSGSAPQTEYSPEDGETSEPTSSDGFIFPNSDTDFIDAQELEVLSDSDLKYTINEIYARHGYIFRSAELAEYYGQFPWYEATIPSEEFSIDCFNQIEMQNWNLLVRERDQRKKTS